MILSVPSKTFLFGEYMVLLGYPAIIANTGPRFELHCNLIGSGPGTIDGIDSESPAGKYIRQNYSFFEKYALEFRDPHGGRGGLGASSAQFALLYALKNYFFPEIDGSTAKEHSENAFDFSAPNLSSLKFNPREYLTAYHEVAWNGQGPAPSGADAISQLVGRSLTYWDFNNQVLRNFEWPFADKGFLLLSTNQKLATHEHLNKINIRSNDEMLSATTKAFDALNESRTGSCTRLPEQQNISDANYNKFIESGVIFREELLKQGWVAENTREIFSELEKSSAIDFYKGCGAMGADIVFVTFDHGNHLEVLKTARSLNLEAVASEKDLSHGLSFHANFSISQSGEPYKSDSTHPTDGVHSSKGDPL